MEVAMAEDALDKIITKLPRSSKTTDPAVRIVGIDSKKGSAVKKPSLFSQTVYFRVANNTDATNEVTKGVTHAFVLDDDKSGAKLEVKAKYRASCPPGNETKLAEALYRGLTHDHGPTAESWLNHQIEKWVREYERDGFSPFEYYEKEDAANLYIKKRAEEET